MDEQKQKYLIIAVSCLGIICVGLWVLLLILLSGGFLEGGLVAQATPTLPPLLPTATIPPPPPTPLPTAPPPTPLPTVPPPTVASPTDTPLPLPSPPTDTPPVAAVTMTPTPGEVISETPPAAFQFVHDEIQRGDGPCGVFGHVYDANGQPLEGVRITAHSEWGWKLESPAISKPVAAPDAGYYDIILTVAPGGWTVQILDEAGLPISDEATFVHSEGMGFCHYVIDWRRTF